MKTPVVIIGGGPGGSAAAMYLAREGIESVIVERETFPRYHVGESMTGEAGAVLRDLGLGDAMNERRHPVKHGVKVYGPDGRHSWFVPVMARDADWQLSEQTTWQVRRSEFDEMMLATAIERGAKLVPGRATKALRRDDGSVYGVEVRVADGGTMQIESELVLDCSGQATFLAGQGVTGPKYLGAYDKQIALFSQVAGSVRDMGEARDQKPGNTLIFYSSKYHWSWFIPLDDEVMSVGVVTPASYFLDRNETKKGYLTAVLHELHPEMDRRLPGDIELVEDVHVIPNYSYQVKRFCGKGFMCIGDAHRFVDPIFSFGLYVTMKEAQLAAPVIKEYLEGGARRDQANPFSDYQVMCEHAIDVLEDSVDLFWEHPFAFAVFVHHRYRHDLIDVFAGRIYERQPSIGVEAFRKMLKRERTYDSEDIYSMPIGSRYHPERAPIWEVASAVESTEKWVVEGMDGWMAAS